jgi:NAD(P)-dependent dehydrogenase (short-subunit alcohol dehydrogenase family)
MKKPLEGKIAVVGGSSRGAGRGIALALGDAGATVYVAARTSRSGPKPADDVPGTIEDTAEEVSRRGGAGIAVRCDLGDEAQVSALFARVEKEQGGLDLAVNAAWGGNLIDSWSKRFWNLPSDAYRETAHSVDTYWWTSVYTARLMSRQKRGLIVFVTDNFYPDPHASRGQVLYDLGHEALNRLITCMSRDAKKDHFAIVGMNPGFMRTERVQIHMRQEGARKQFRYDLSESPEYIGRAVAALAADPEASRRNGELLWACDLAEQYGFTDIDGRRVPRFDPNAPIYEPGLAF